MLAGIALPGCGPAESRAKSRQAASEPPTPATAPAPPERRVDPRIVALAEAHIEELMAKYYLLGSRLQNVRAQLELFSLRGRSWSPGPDSKQPWEELIGRGFLEAEPVNPLSPRKVATRIHVINEPGATGEAVSPKTAGWVWNSADGTLDAARDSAAIAACRREHDLRVIREKAGPFLDPVLATLRGQVALYQLYEADLWRDGSVAKLQWRPLIRAGYIGDPPVNPLSPGEVCTKIVEIRTSGARGSAVDTDAAGWVWNSADRELYAAGYDD